MDAFEFFVAGEPKAQGRPRAFSFEKGGKTMVRVYDPKTSEGWKSLVAEAAKAAKAPTFQGAVSVRLDFYFTRPKGHYGKNALRGGAPKEHTQRPDLDNLAKAVMDCLTRLGVWHDDSIVVRMDVSKHWAGFVEAGCNIAIQNL